MNLKDRVAGLDLPNLGKDEKVSKVLGAALGCGFDVTQRRASGFPQGRRKGRKEEVKEYFWGAEYFNLDRVGVFQAANEEEKREILRLCSQGLLAETYLVEKAGIGYMAKMTLLAESTEERMVYALFSADEAKHLAEVDLFYEPKELPNDVFSEFLTSFLQCEDKAVLLFVVQVILEGWGLSHYRSLAKNCLDENLSQMYAGFLEAEARHHAMGVTSFVPYCESIETQEAIAQALSIFLHLVRVGPVSVVSAIECVKSGLSMAERIEVFQQLDTENHSHQRLQLLRSLIYRSGAASLAEQLEKYRLFEPLSAEQCAKFMSN
jgi:hypothetical protein